MKKFFWIFITLFSLHISGLTTSKITTSFAETLQVSDEEYARSYHLKQLNASKALLNTFDGKNVKVAILDSGINFEHEEFLKGNQMIISDSSAYVDTGNYYTLENCNYNRDVWLNNLKDTTGHGTHVASLIAAQKNGKGIVGVAPNVELIIVKMATNSDGLYEFQTIINAIHYAYTVKADVINLSIAGYSPTDSYTSFINNEDQDHQIKPIIVAAAGNDNKNSPYYPASASNIISVAASSKENYNEPASFTNYGKIDVAAPGYTYGAYKDGNASYRDWNGTSFSTPLVSGLAALFLQKNPHASRDEFVQALKEKATKITETTKNGWSGSGLVDANKLLDFEASALTLSLPTYPAPICDKQGNSIEQVLDLSDIGWKFDLNVEAYPRDYTLPKFHYVKSTNPDVIKITGNKLEVVGPGETIVRVESIGDSNVCGEISLIVENRNELENNPVLIAGSKGNILNFELYFEDSLPVEIDESWKNATEMWAYDGNDYFYGDKENNLCCVYEDLGAKIYYQSFNDNGDYVIDYKIINVVDAEIKNVESVTLDRTNLELEIGDTSILTPSITPLDATIDGVIWKSSDDTVVSVKNGVLTAISEGTVDIVAITLEGYKTAKCKVTVLRYGNDETTLIEDIEKGKLEFTKKRSKPDDLRNLKQLIDNLTQRLENIANKNAITNSDDIAHMKVAIDFLENDWYGSIRVFSNEEWSICEAIKDKDLAKTIVDIYDNLDNKTQKILADTYDVDSSEGLVTIGKSIKYIATTLTITNEIADETDLSSFSPLTANYNTLITVVTISFAVILFAIACVVVIFLKRNNKKKNY